MARSGLPDGTVTFVFTDIEGSTRLIEELGEQGYVEALAQHRKVLRAAFAAGAEVDTQGDAFLYAFADPAEALDAAVRGQAALSGGPVKVRMGLHTGEPLLTDEGYAGRELHRAARIGASGHGGQVVVSSATRALVDGELTDLGEHRLKDFDEPVPLFQLGSERFPPLKTISNTNLPRPASSFVGRQRERGELVDLLRSGTRLVTLSGPGGSGKTRLGLEVATELVPEFKAGVFWVGLAALREPALVAEEIAHTLGAKDGLADHIGERELLLLLDNFEQVVEAAPDLGGLLESCPKLKCLVTSRELLRIRGEVDYPVPPLAEPEAVVLFCERARVEPDETIAQLCRHLDDLPLALELAAARTSVLSPAQILERLSQRLDLLKGGRDAEARQQTLRATIEWSHELLGAEEQSLFARLAVFRGGCTLEAAEQVADAGLDTLQSLVDKSLVRQTEERFWMLETIREYARERLSASGAEAELVRRHADWYLAFVETIDRGLDEGGDDVRNFARIGAEHENLRAALEHARDAGEDELLLRLAAALANFWDTRAFYRELDVWLPLALERGSSPASARIKVLNWASIRAHARQEWASSEVLIQEWRSLAEQEGDEHEVLAAMISEAINASQRSDFDSARAQFAAIAERAREIGDRKVLAGAIMNLGNVDYKTGDFQSALEHSLAGSRLFQELGRDFEVAIALTNCGWFSLSLGEPTRAEEFFRDSAAIFGRLGAIGAIAAAIPGLAAALVAQDDASRAAQMLGAAASLRIELGVGFNDAEEEQVNDRAVADARAALGEEAFAEAWARGQAMTTEEILAFTMPA